jgi:transposase
MKKVSKQMLLKETALLKPSATVGLDLGDRFSHYCLLNAEGEVIEEGRMQTTEAALRRHFGDGPCLRIALECGTHSPWVSLLLKALGHQVLQVHRPRSEASGGGTA